MRSSPRTADSLSRLAAPAASEPWRLSTIADRLFDLAVWASAILVIGTFIWLFGDLLMRGAGELSWHLLTRGVQDSGRAGGIAPILVATVWIVVIALAVAFPLALATAIVIAEIAPRESRLTCLVVGSLDVLAGTPSVVFGLFGNALFNHVLGLGYSLISGGLTLACMILPFMIRANVVGLRAVPDSYREAGEALAISRATALFHVLLPAALPSIAAGVLLGLARALAETAALLFTSGYVTRMPESLLDSGRTVSIHIYDLAMNVAGGDAMAYASALVLVMLLILINFSVVSLSRWLQIVMQRA